MSVNNFDVLKTMAERNLKISIAPLSNVIRANYYAKRGTEVTIGCAGQIVVELERGAFVGGLILADREQYEQICKELAAAPPTGGRDA